MERTPGRAAPRLAILTLVAAALGLLLWRFGLRPGAPPAPPPSASSSATASAGRPAAPPARRVAQGPIRLAPAVAERGTADPQGSFEGRVLSWATGGGIAGAELVFEHAGVSASVTAGEGGAFRFEPREAGPYRLALATAAGHTAYSPEWGHSPVALEARPGERIRGVTIYLSPAIEYVGAVRDPVGRPVKGATVRVLDAGEGGAAPAAGGLVTDAEGEVRFSAPDGALLEARHPSFSPARARLDAQAQASRRVILKLRAPGVAASSAASAEETIEGRVVDARGEGVGGALVRAAYADDPPHLARLRPAPRAICDAEGRFLLEGLDPGRHDLAAVAEGLAPAEAKGVASGARGVVLALAAAGGAIRGAVRDAATGEPVAAFTVLVSARVGPLQRRLFTTAGVFDAAGHYEVRGLPPADYLVTVAGHGRALAAEVEVRIPDPPGEPATADFALTRGGRVTGTVLDEATSGPIEGARVSVEGASWGDAADLPLLAATTSDAAGHFEVAGLQAGLRSISVVAAGHHGRILSGLQVKEGGELGPIAVKLKPTAEGEEPRMELTGIGAVLSAKDDALVIGETLEGGGAREAGLVAGDAILAVDGHPVTDLGFEGAVQRIRGPEGSSVALTVRKAAGGEAREVVVFRRRIGT